MRHSPETPETTNVVVNRLLARRRSMRAGVAFGVALLAAFAAYMALSFGHDRRSELAVDGPVYSGRTFAAAEGDAPVAAAGAGPAAAAAPAAAPAPATITVKRGRRTTLQVDGAPVEGAPDQPLSLAPGKHSLVVRDGERTLVQRLEVAAGERFEVTFGSTVKVVKR